MRTRELTSIAAIACFVASCLPFDQLPRPSRRDPVKEVPFVRPEATPAASFGYLAGEFSGGTAYPGYGFILVDALGREFPVAFDEVFEWYGLQKGQPGMIALPPADYRVKYWMNSFYAKNDIPADSRIAQPFAVRPGHVVFLGSFVAGFSQRLTSQKFDSDGAFRVRSVEYSNEFSITPLPVRADWAWMRLTQAYPGFTTTPLECILCEAPTTGTAANVKPVSPVHGDFTSKHDVVVHVFRPDPNRNPIYEVYLTCTLTAWELEAGTGARREVIGASALKPMRTDHRDAFGAFWVLNDLNFKDGRVHFSVQCEGTSLQGTEASVWDLSAGREAWVNEGDPRVYTSREAAVAAQVQPPSGDQGPAAQAP